MVCFLRRGQLALLFLFVLMLVSGAARAQNWSWASAPTFGAMGVMGSVRMAVDGAGNEYVAGTFDGSLTLGAVTLTSEGQRDAFVAKRSAAGTWLWAVRTGGNGADDVTGLAVDGSGNVLVCGGLSGSGTAFGAITIPASNTGKQLYVAKLSAGGVWQWATVANGSYNFWANGLAVDGNGSAYLVGSFQTTASFGSSSITAVWHSDVFVAKINGSGAWQWAVRGGGNNWDEAKAVAADGAGGVYVTGTFSSSAADFGSTTLANQYSSSTPNAFVAKVSGSGLWQWATLAAGPLGAYGQSIAVDAGGNAYVSGSFKGGLTFGSQQLTASTGGNSFVGRVSGAGAWQWAVLGAPQSSYYYGEMTWLATDAAGSAYVTGALQGAWTVGATTLPAPTNGADAYVAKLTSTGTWGWAARAGGSDSDVGQGIGVDGTGKVHVAGLYSSRDAVFGSIALACVTRNDIFVGKLDAGGNWLAATRIGAPAGGNSGQAVARDGAGNTYVTGYFRGTLTFGTRVLTSAAGSGDVYIAKLGPTGQWLWAVRAGGNAEDQGTGISVTTTGAVYVTGTFRSSTAAFGGVTLTNGGAADAFVAKLTSTGTWQWAKRAGGSGEETAVDVAVDGSGNAYVTGAFGGVAAFGAVTLTSAGTSDAYVGKLNASGTWLWAVRAGGTDGVRDPKGIGVDGGGNAYVVGRLGGTTATFGTTTLTNTGAWYGMADAFVARLTSGGAWQWVWQGSGLMDEQATDVAVDGIGNAYVTGYFGSATLTLGATTLTNSTVGPDGIYDQEDVFVGKITAAGAWQWAAQAGRGGWCPYGAATGGSGHTNVLKECGAYSDKPSGIAVDGAGEVYVAMSLAENFSGPLVGPAGAAGAGVGALSGSGAWRWLLPIGYWVEARAIGVDAGGTPVVTGMFNYGNAQFLGTTLPGMGHYIETGFVAQVVPTAPPQPTLTSLTPSVGYTGTVVTIQGTGFLGATSVTFNGTAASSFVVDSATQLKAVVPAGATTGPISVTTPGGTATSLAFTVAAPPTITGMSPGSGGAGATVVLTGTWFGGASSVTFNGKAATFTYYSPTQLTAVVPAGATTGKVSVTATGGTGQSAANFVVTSPAVLGFTPSSGVTGTTVTVTGTNFTGATGVKFNGVAATSFTVNSATSLTVTVPSLATTGKITVTTPSGMDHSAGLFGVLPTVTGFTPALGGVGTSVTINGSGFAGVTQVGFHGAVTTTFTINSVNRITVVVPAGAQTGRVGVWTAAGSAGSATDFTVAQPPTITGFSPAAGPAGSSVTITGTNFTGATAVQFNGAAASGFTINSATSVTATVPTNASTGRISITTPGGSAQSTGSFTLTSPGSFTLTPQAGKVSTLVTLMGAGFGGATSVKFNGTAAGSFTVNSSGTAITVAVPTGATSGPVTVTGSAGVAQSLTSFGVVPIVAGVAPASGPVGTSVALSGTGFSAVAASNIVYFGSVRAQVTAATTTRLTVTVPRGATYGPPSVTVAGRTGVATRPFLVTFGGGGPVGPTSLGARATLGTGLAPTALAAGDLDGDGRPDLVVVNQRDNTISLLRSVAVSGALTAASFAPRVSVAVGQWPRGVALADVDGDGRLDVLVANAGANTVSVLRNQMTGPGAFTASSLAAPVDFVTAVGPVAVAAGDIDLDGRPEVVVADSVGAKISVFGNQAVPGVITAASLAAKVDFSGGNGSAPDLVVADVNGDYRADVITGGSGSVVIAWRSAMTVPGPITASSLAGLALGQNGKSVRLGDLDSDGKPDLVTDVVALKNTSTAGSAPSNWFTAGVRSVPAVAAVAPGGLALGDLDGGGKVDVLAAEPGVNGLEIFSNQATTGATNNILLAQGVSIGVGRLPRAVVVADLDGDGRVDVATADYGDNTISLLRNQAGAPRPAMAAREGGGERLADELQAEVHPNPAHGRATLRLEGGAVDAGELRLTVLDALGHAVQARALAAGTRDVLLEVDVLKPGLYLVRVEAAGGKAVTCRLVVGN